MIDCLDASRYFIMGAYQDRLATGMTKMKVQKLLYYSQSLHLALYDEPLFAEEIQAWRYGPVCPPAYRFYSEFEAQQLPAPNQESLSDIPSETRELLEEVWEFFGGYNAFGLSEMTHLEFPWQNARKSLPSDARSTEKILHDDLKKLGYQKLELIEHQNHLYQTMMTEIVKDGLALKSPNRIVIREILDS